MGKIMTEEFVNRVKRQALDAQKVSKNCQVCLGVGWLTPAVILQETGLAVCGNCNRYYSPETVEYILSLLRDVESPAKSDET